ncbi:MAG: hypothetical protein ACTJHT_09405 [Sphingobacterium sp.]
MEKDYSEKDVQERLKAAGLFAAYEEAVKLKDSLKIQTLLQKISIEDDTIVAILEDLDTDISS